MVRLNVETRSGRALVAGGLEVQARSQLAPRRLRGVHARQQGSTVAELKAAFHEASKQRKARLRPPDRLQPPPLPALPG